MAVGVAVAFGVCVAAPPLLDGVAVAVGCPDVVVVGTEVGRAVVVTIRTGTVVDPATVCSAP